MIAASETLDALGGLLTYPGDDVLDRADRALATSAAPEIRESIREFRGMVAALDSAEREELYTRTFDLNPVCCLEVGWHLWGDRYERGDFLARVRALLREHGVPENGELPDHLSHVLPLVGRLPEETVTELVGKVLRPALTKMLAALGDETNPWRSVLAAASTATGGAR